MAVGLQRALMMALLALSAPVWAAKKVDLDYHVRLLPQSDQAEVRLTLAKGEAVRSLDFDLGDGSHYSDFKADGQWLLTPGKNARGVWRPTSDKASLTYRVRISHGRKNGSFDTRMTPNWALMRGDELVPPAKLDQQDGTELVARLQFELPDGWKSIETAWPRIGKTNFVSTTRHACSTVRPGGCSLATSAAAVRAWAKPKSPWPRRKGRACAGWTC